MHFSAALPSKLKHRKNPNKQEENAKFYVRECVYDVQLHSSFSSFFFVHFHLFRIGIFRARKTHS